MNKQNSYYRNQCLFESNDRVKEALMRKHILEHAERKHISADKAFVEVSKELLRR